MKNIINHLIVGKLYFLNLFVYQMQYLKKSQKFSFEFLILLNFDIFAIQQNISRI